jgi:hypothetical protein
MHLWRSVGASAMEFGHLHGPHLGRCLLVHMYAKAQLAQSRVSAGNMIQAGLQCPLKETKTSICP